MLYEVITRRKGRYAEAESLAMLAVRRFQRAPGGGDDCGCSVAPVLIVLWPLRRRPRPSRNNFV